jgi:small nuclear ribonucleoprotein (snRNP)-like protein
MVNCSSTSTSIEKVENLVGERIKCTLDDGRYVTGTFLCLDRLTNIILSNAVEERNISSADYSETTHEHIVVTRNLSQAMIPGERLRKVEVDAATFQLRVAVLDR